MNRMRVTTSPKPKNYSKRFYGPLSILKRLRNRANRADWFLLRTYLFVNALLRVEASQREDYPLGDLGFKGGLVKVAAGVEVP